MVMPPRHVGRYAVKRWVKKFFSGKKTRHSSVKEVSKKRERKKKNEE